MPSLTWDQEVVKWALLVGAPAAIAFPIYYHLKARWWKTPTGRDLFTYSLVVALVYTVIVFRVIISPTWDPEMFKVYRVGIYVALAFVLWQRLYILIRAQQRRDQPRNHRPELPVEDPPSKKESHEE